MNKNISLIQYNSLNLPSSITYQNGNMASYVYSAAGGKLSVSYQTGTGNTSTQYCGNIIYDDNNLSQVLIDGGYITFSGTTPQYHYYLQDHLGSNRVVVSQGGTVEQVNHYYPFGGIIADISTDGDVQKYKYNGKELDLMHGLNTYDYGARQYNPVTARWDRVDPLCEKYYSVSPYNYCGGKPIRFIDIDGFVWKDINGNIIKKHDGIKVYIFYDKDAFTMQSYAMYKEAERIYGKGSVALSDAMTTNSFEEDWKNMASNNIAEVNLNYHGNNQTIFLNASKGEYLTATGNGFTNTQPQSRRVAADNVQDLPNPIGNISHAQLNINSCRSNGTNQKPLLGSGKTLMKVFADSFIFQAVRGTSVGVSYSRWDLLPHPQYLASEGWFKNWEYIGQPIQIPAAAPVFKFTDALYFKTGGMK